MLTGRLTGSPHLLDNGGVERLDACLQCFGLRIDHLLFLLQVQNFFQAAKELAVQINTRLRLIGRPEITTKGLQHCIRLFYQRRFHTSQNMIAPERLQLHNRILLLIEVALNLLPYEVVLIVGKQACDKGDIDVHDGHVVSHLQLIMAWHRAIRPLELHIIVRGFAFEDGLSTIRKHNEPVYIGNQERENRMLVHPVVFKDRQAGLLGEDLSHHILEQMPNLESDALIRTFICHDHSDLVIVEFSGRAIRRGIKGDSYIAAANPFAPPVQPLILSEGGDIDQLIGCVIQIQRHNSLLLTTVETTFTAFRALSIVQILKRSEVADLAAVAALAAAQVSFSMVKIAVLVAGDMFLKAHSGLRRADFNSYMILHTGLTQRDALGIISLGVTINHAGPNRPGKHDEEGMLSSFVICFPFEFFHGILDALLSLLLGKAPGKKPLSGDS